MKFAKIILIPFIFYACQSTKPETHHNEEEWIPLFNGYDLSDWDIKIAGYPMNHNYLETFRVEDSTIRISYDQYEEFNDAYGHMYYQIPYSYYKIRFDYRFVGEQLKGGEPWNVRNSGIMLHSQSAASNEIKQAFPVSIELQLLGGLDEGDRTTANVCTPGTAVELGDTVNYDHCINSVSKTYHGDRWVHVEAIVLGGESMTFYVEEDSVLSFSHPQIGGGFISAAYEGQDWEAMGILEDKESWINKAGTILSEGYIALQAESHPVDFKNIYLLNLAGCMDPQAKNYKSYYVDDKPETCIY